MKKRVKWALFFFLIASVCLFFLINKENEPYNTVKKTEKTEKTSNQMVENYLKDRSISGNVIKKETIEQKVKSKKTGEKTSTLQSYTIKSGKGSFQVFKHSDGRIEDNFDETRWVREASKDFGIEFNQNLKQNPEKEVGNKGTATPDDSKKENKVIFPNIINVSPQEGNTIKPYDRTPENGLVLSFLITEKMKQKDIKKISSYIDWANKKNFIGINFTFSYPSFDKILNIYDDRMDNLTTEEGLEKFLQKEKAL